VRKKIHSVELSNKIVADDVGLSHTKRKHRNSARILRESREGFKSIIEAAPIPLTIGRKSDSRILYANELLFQALGMPAEAKHGKTLLDFCCDRTDLRKVIDILRRDGFVRDLEVRARRANGTEFWASISISPVMFKGDHALLVGIYDLTTRKVAELKLQELYDRERDVRQHVEAEMNRRIEFVKMLAHELKTPLTPVLASSDSLVAELQDERLLSLAKNISRGAYNLNKRIDELLDLERVEVGILEINPEPIDLIPVLREVAESMTPLAVNKGLSLQLRLPSSLPLVRVDITRVQEIVLNLLNNAFKFTSRGGEVKLSATHRNALVIVEVQDTGPGISKDERDRVFEPYYRVSRDRGRLTGLGLGLALCKRLVELHRGQIWVKSHPSIGSTFGFSLPIDKVGALSTDEKKPNKLWKVLIIEGEQEIVDSISMVFRKDWTEAEPVSAATGEEGIDLVEMESPDMVILDLYLPDMSGLEVLRQVRLFSSVPVVVLSASNAEDDVARALDWGANDYIIKPFRKKELLARLKAQLRKQIPVEDEAPIVCGSLCFDPVACQLRYGDSEVSLTIIEGRIITCLMKHAGQVVSYSRLAEAVWAENYDGATVSLRSHIRRLRKKLEPDPGHPILVLTKSGIGYSLAVQSK